MQRKYQQGGVVTILSGVLLLQGMAFAEMGFEAGWQAYRAAEFEQAYHIWEPLAEAGKSNAQNNLALLYLRGQGVDKDSLRAAYWFQRAGNKGNIQALTSLGVMYMTGDGVERDYYQAFELFYRAAKAGSSAAQYNLGRMYAEGIGVSLNYYKAMKWFRMASEQGHSRAQSAKARLLKQGLGLQKLPYPKDSRWSKFG